jgi:hypothetical protein
MLELTPNNLIVKAYLKDLQQLRNQQAVHVLALQGPFQNLLTIGREVRLDVVPELSTYSCGKRVVSIGAKNVMM